MPAINPICGRQGCKYKVPHEHVQFTGVTSIDEILPSLKFSKIDPHSPKAIQNSLLKLDAQEDPAASRFKEVPPWWDKFWDTMAKHYNYNKYLNDITVEIRATTSNMAKTAIEVATLKTAIKYDAEIYKKAFEALLTAANKRLSFVDVVIANVSGMFIGGVLLIGGIEIIVSLPQFWTWFFGG